MAYNPEANGKAERGHQTLVAALVKAAEFESARWVDLFPFALWADRSTTHRTTGFTPIELMHGNRPSLPIEDAIATWSALLWMDGLSQEDLLALRIRQLQRREIDVQEGRRRMKETKQKEKERVDVKRRRHPRPLEVGDWVLRRNERIEAEVGTHRKFAPRWFGPFVVKDKSPETGTYELRELEGTTVKGRVAGKQLKVFRRREGTGDGGESSDGDGESDLMDEHGGESRGGRVAEDAGEA